MYKLKINCPSFPYAVSYKQVEFLCERGADVNRGQRSSSLHYAACFGRPQVAKVIFFLLCL